ncbi:hypothetical protein CWR45_03085 [Oceanobacillus chungangensis]|uniref:Uncharacterized protein n=1 Tax=Oceanobacillus chungangensis TaxID=1229152 RepID=A0A3D8PYW1_9BACI|nr:hypothetical protein CWR45_03085 [Oceanobacillus chungangensis]
MYFYLKKFCLYIMQLMLMFLNFVNKIFIKMFKLEMIWVIVYLFQTVYDTPPVISLKHFQIL